MTRDALADLLQEADATAPPPPAPQPGLAERIRARRRNLVRRRTAAVAIALPVVVIAASITLVHTRHVEQIREIAHSTAAIPSAPATTSADADALRMELARLKAEANVRLAVADGVRAELDRRLLEARVTALASSEAAPDRVRLERDRAALTLIDHGDRLRRDFKEADAAVAAYRRTIELFPGSRWAAVAKARIESLRSGARLTAPDPSFMS